MRIGDFNQSRRLARLFGPRAIALVMASVTLSACLHPQSEWSEAEAIHNNKVEWVKFTHPVTFSNGGSSFSSAERERLDDFLSTMDVGHRDQIMVGIRGKARSATEAQLADRRSGVVKAYLSQHRLPARVLPENGTDDAWDGAVTVFVGRYILTPPDCPNWGKPADTDSANRTASNLGCATARNLGLMLANPGDLVRTQPLGPADGEAAATTIQKYRQRAIDESSATINTVGSQKEVK